MIYIIIAWGILVLLFAKCAHGQYRFNTRKGASRA